MLPKSSDAENNMVICSKYYNGNVSKVGVATQLYEWERLLELNTDAAGNSNYIKAVNILELQEEFVRNNITTMRDVTPFTNIFDKGY